jgi:hypothetical protein
VNDARSFGDYGDAVPIQIRLRSPRVIANTPPARSSRRWVRVLMDWSDMACLKKIWPVTEQATENTTRQKKKSVTVSPPRARPTCLQKKHRALPAECRSGAATKLPLLKGVAMRTQTARTDNLESLSKAMCSCGKTDKRIPGTSSIGLSRMDLLYSNRILYISLLD